MFRTADGAGVGKMYVCGITPSPLDRFGRARPDFLKVSLGAEKFVAWEKAASVVQVIKKLKAEGFMIFAVEQNKKSVPYFSPRARRGRAGKVALIVGAETRGLPPSILKLADEILEIPMRGKKESLNVSVAFGVVAYTLNQKSNIKD